jgi:hypothetical protein
MWQHVDDASTPLPTPAPDPVPTLPPVFVTLTATDAAIA